MGVAIVVVTGRRHERRHVQLLRKGDEFGDLFVVPSGMLKALKHNGWMVTKGADKHRDVATFVIIGFRQNTYTQSHAVHSIKLFSILPRQTV